MTIYHIEYAKTGLNLSGGEVWMVELIKQLQSRKIRNVLLTTDNGKRAYEKVGLTETKYLKIKTIDSYKAEKKLPIFFSYVVRTFQAVRETMRSDITNEDVIICHSDFFPNTIPFLLTARKAKKSKKVAMFHMLAPDLLKGYENHFGGDRKMPTFRIAHYKFNQWLYFRIVNHLKSALITNNDYYVKILRKRHVTVPIHVLKHFAGAERVVGLNEEKTYDVAWMGRFHAQKGLGDLVRILRIIKAQRPDFKAIVIGDGDRQIKKSFMSKLKKHGLEANVEFAGFVVGEKRLKLIGVSRIFVMTSHYESFGLVNLEALTNGTPVVAYDLPVYTAFKKGLLRVPINHSSEFAELIIQILKDKSRYSKLRDEGLSLSRDFSWKKTCDETLRVINATGGSK